MRTVVLSKLIQSLISSSNGAADTLLLEALALGNTQEKLLVLDALIERRSSRGLLGVVACAPTLPMECHRRIVQAGSVFQQPIRLAARDRDATLRLAAIDLISRTHATDLSYLLCEHLRDMDANVARGASRAFTAMVLRHRSHLRRLSRRAPDITSPQMESFTRELREVHQHGMELESGLLHAAAHYRGSRLSEIARSVILMAQSPESPLMPLFQNERHFLAEMVVRQLQHPTRVREVPSLLLACTRGAMRTRFPITFGNITSPRVLAGLLSYTHRLKDHALQISIRATARGVWLEPTNLSNDLMARTPQQAADIGAWIANSALAPDIQGQLFLMTYIKAQSDTAARARLLFHVLQAHPSARVPALRQFVADPDDGIAICAARALGQHNVEDLPTLLLPLLKRASTPLRRLVSRLVGERSFEQYWLRFEHMPRISRQQAGRAMLKLVGDAPRRVAAKALSGPLRQRLKAMDIADELDLISGMGDTLSHMVVDPDPRIRSRVVMLLRDHRAREFELILTRALLDSDDRVRANAIEVIEKHGSLHYAELLNQRAMSRANRERANAIKALHSIDPDNAIRQLRVMLADRQAEHRISAMWVLRELQQWQLLTHVAEISRNDQDLSVRRYALTLLRSLCDRSIVTARDSA